MTGKAYYLTTFGEWRHQASRFANSHFITADPGKGIGPIDDASEILTLVEADEGVHLELEQHPSWQALPHPLSSRPVPASIAAKLGGRGVTPGATAFDLAEAVGQSHPLLRHRVF
jgi:hypothetical protein